MPQWGTVEYGVGQYGLGEGAETSTVSATSSLGCTFEITSIADSAVETSQLVTRTVWNQFDEHGLACSLRRLKGETNWEFRRRILDVYAHRANSTYQGLVNGITRELGLALFDAISINPRLNADGSFACSDPYISFDGVYLLLYSDYANDSLDWAIDRRQAGGNFEHLGALVDQVNLSSAFEASLCRDVDPYTKSMTILNQTNREQVRIEFLPVSTKFKLQNKYLVPGTVFFSNRTTFRSEVANSSLVLLRGQYHIDYTKGIVTVYTLPESNDHVRYSYTVYPFVAEASPIILNDLNSETFKVAMFNQVLQDNGTYEHGLPTELGADILNELLAVSPRFYGV